MDLIRSMIERVEITPRATATALTPCCTGTLRRSWLRVARLGSERKQPAVGDGGLQVMLVAGTRNHRELTLHCLV